MSITVACPVCGRTLRVARENIGRKGKCGCGHILTVTEPPVAATTSRSALAPPPIAVMRGEETRAGMPHDAGSAAEAVTSQSQESGLKLWARETTVAEGFLGKALVCSLGLMLAGTALISVLPFLIFLGFVRSPATAMGVYLRVVYSVLVVVPVVVLFQVNAILYLFPALLGVQVNYAGSMYGAVNWIERKKLYREALDAFLRANNA